ncbi:WD40 domain-containing protein [Encephalitozoon intestinalis ATCC 50506]|uniref:WD40 domain-containing protein n=1 Tax=Encephalitozoon intestinalis (strain ATCC 50506) TaxID=876142 RepID=E0S8G5_ENCIT|nr:WD40 domain-containing protein [Encephalitozoon intestinalis ATCC 50506]ADM11959.1 WD40 domain-containing protein [Encephalitozoon intestinalis ATCC 50506]UTX45743.1 WD40 domain-containing protein [Encephalitozoon intestinalis]
MKLEKMSKIKSLGHPASSIDLAISENRRYLLSVGVYKPCVKIYDFENLAQKVERHLESEPARVLSLVPDASKICILRGDRTIEFHAKYGHHEGIRTPTVCFDICLNKFRAELMSGGKGSAVYRFNLDQGRFLRSYAVTIDEIYSIEMNECNGLIGVGGAGGVQFIDQRCKEIVKSVEYNESPSSITFAENGIDFGVGTNEGTVYFHDLRARKELFSVKHDQRIKKVTFNGKILISLDRGALRCCSRTGMVGEYLSSSEMNCLTCDGGVVFIGLDNGEISEMISEDLGEIPQWCKVFGDQVD